MILKVSLFLPNKFTSREIENTKIIMPTKSTLNPIAMRVTKLTIEYHVGVGLATIDSTEKL